MQKLWAAPVFFALGCASTVARLPGELPTQSGNAKSACESTEWLVLAPTESQEVSHSGRSSVARKDGFGAYRVGQSQPESIPGLAERLGSSPIIDRHRAGVERYDNKLMLAGGLGAAGVIALGIGTYLFATSFETKTSTNSDGTKEEEQEVNGGKLGGGAALIGAGFGLGIAGIVVSPGTGERARADQARYVFTPPEDDPEAVKALVDRHNSGVRDRCSKAPASGAR